MPTTHLANNLHKNASAMTSCIFSTQKAANSFLGRVHSPIPLPSGEKRKVSAYAHVLGQSP